MPEPVEALLRELLSEIRGMRADLRGGKASSLTRNDRVILERLLPAIGLLFPEEELFTAREVRKHPAPGLGILLDGMDTRSIGRLLTRAAGVPIAGNTVDCSGRESNVVLYRVRKTDLR